MHYLCTDGKLTNGYIMHKATFLVPKNDIIKMFFGEIFIFIFVYNKRHLTCCSYIKVCVSAENWPGVDSPNTYLDGLLFDFLFIANYLIHR